MRRPAHGAIRAPVPGLPRHTAVHGPVLQGGAGGVQRLRGIRFGPRQSAQQTAARLDGKNESGHSSREVEGGW